MSNRIPRKEDRRDLVEFIHQRNMVCSLALLESLEKHHGVPVEVVVEPVVEPEPETVLPPIPNELMAAAHVSLPLISIRDIQLVVCKEFGILIGDMLSGRRAMKYVLPRHVAIYLSKKLTKLSFPAIAQRFGMDHSSLLHAVWRIEQKMAIKPELAERIVKLEYRLGGIVVAE